MAAALEAVRRSPLLERPSDAFYAFYLFMHLWPALLIDSQAFLDLRFVPSGLQKVSATRAHACSCVPILHILPLPFKQDWQRVTSRLL